MGLTQILIIMVIVLVLFGPEDLPMIARKLGKITYQIRKASDEFSRELQKAVDIPNTIVNDAFEQTVSAPSGGSELRKAGGEKAKDEAGAENDAAGGSKGSEKDGAQEIETIDAETKDAETGEDEVLLTYDDEKPGEDTHPAEKQGSIDPLSELPPDMVSYEEKGVG